MGKIRLLDEESIRLIAAGEVVERPSSVAKELLENSIDAESGNITLEIAGGGKSLIRVSDDGCGMSPEDARLALERHATSKIKSVDDLLHLSTFGFRGEALPSIAAVSRLKLSARSETDPHGTEIAVEGGKIVSQSECGRPRGATIEVKDLFFNTPARLKFLKSDSSEKSRIFRAFEEISIAHPSIFFESKNEGKTAAALPPRDSALRRLADLWDEEFSEETLFPLHFEHPFLKIEGWVSQPQFHQATKNYQIFYINQRPVVSRLLSSALYESFRDCLPVGRHPVAVIFLTLDATQVDVNVHPSKREVRFRSEPQIYDALLREIRSKRSSESTAPRVFFGNPEPGLRSVPVIAPPEAFAARPPSFQGAQTSYDFQIPKPGRQAPAQTAANLLERPRVIGQFHDLYILLEQGTELVLVDQHAANERVLYERFKKRIESGESIAAQPLLIPVIWNTNAVRAALIKGSLQTFLKLGLVIEEFGERTFRVREAPAQVPESELQALLEEMAGSLENDKEPGLTLEKTVMRMACRAAVKAGDKLSGPEMSNIVQEVQECSNPHTCPHGRPVRLVLSRAELDKKFGRTY